MKNLTKIFMAVMAGMFAFSCVTDATEDLGIKVEGQGGVELTLSLEESRTQLGEKVDGVYPLYWSEGDAIAVNGVVSAPLAADAAGLADATFGFTKELAYPLCVVYPAAAATAEPEVTTYPVNFASTQPYTVGTFAPQSAPMYGYAAAAPAEGEAAAIQLNHLTGVLRLALKGNGEKVNNIVVKSHTGAIAGPHTVDCTTGALTALDGASNSITVTCGDGLVLGAEAQVVYVAVPAGSYGTFAITINTEANGKMTVKFNSDIKPINAGAVREFSEFEYYANANDAEGEFIIDSAEALIEFAKVAGTFYPRTSAKVVAEIDMTGKEWTPIAYFGEYEFDGGNFEIKGLSAPLFNKTAATIKNLKLTGVDIEEKSEGYVGSIARVVNGGTLTNCSAAGTLEMNNTTFNKEITSNYNDINIGGLVGRSVSATYLNCTNQVAVTVTSFIAPDCEHAHGATVGGITGRALTRCSFEDCTNDAKILYNGTTAPANMYLSGLVGSILENFDTIHLKDLTNTKNGIIEVAEKAESKGGYNIRGCIGVIYDGQDAVENIVNHADIKFLGQATGAVNIAGVGGNLGAGDCVAKKLVNNGHIYYSGTSGDNTQISGVASYLAGNVKHNLEECVNNGNITFDGSNGTKTLTIGGITAYCSNGTAELNNCTNNGSITIDSTVGTLYVGGIMSYCEKDVAFKKCANNGNITLNGQAGTTRLCGFMSHNNNGGSATYTDCTNSGTIENKGTATAITIFSGFLGYANSNTKPVWTNCTNSGTVKNSGTVTGNLFMGGYFGYNTAGTVFTWTNCKNSGEICATGKHNGDNKAVRVGGFIGGSYGTCKFYSCTNEGAVTGNMTDIASNTEIFVGGFLSNVESGWGLIVDKAEGSDQPCINTGTITLSGDCGDFCGVAGLISVPDHATTASKVVINNAVNTGEVKYVDATCTGNTYVAGVLGYQQNGKYGFETSNLVNTGTITVNNAKGKTLNIGGIYGRIASGTAPTGTVLCVCDINVTNATSTERTSIGGIIGSTTVAITGAESYCNIKAIDLQGKAGMIMGIAYAAATKATNCSVGGNMIFATETGTDAGGVEETVDVKTPITADNFFEHIYTDKISQADAKAAGCSLLAEKPTLPTYTPAN